MNPTTSRTLAASALLSLGLAPLAAGQAQRQAASVPFPMDVADTEGALGSWEFAPRSDEFVRYLELDSMRMSQVTLPSGDKVALDLSRVEFNFEKIGMHVDGKETPGWNSGDLSLWSGTVVGDPFSEVTIGFSSLGSYGWISTMAETWHLSSFPAEDNDWSELRSRIWAESMADLVRDPSERMPCLSEELPTDLGQNPTAGSSGSFGRGTLKECKVAVETDYQLYQRFNSLAAEQNYMALLLGAISNRYETEVDVVLTYPYLMFHTTSNDGWSTPDNGGSTGDMLSEFRAAWQGNIPAGGHLAHFISGAGLGGGIAYVDVLCNPDFGFGVSANLGTNTSFPVSQGSGNWDFYVICHELGHNFSSPHTHSYCPPLDNCAPAGYFGQCQTTQACTNQGTIMSYCHLCSGGTTNITTYFHPTVQARMRSAVASSCLPDYQGGGGGCQDDIFEPNNSCTQTTPLGVGLSSGYIAKEADVDVFEIAVPQHGSLTVNVLFTHAAGDIDARLENEGCTTTFVNATSSSDNEQLVWQNGTGGPRNVKLTVYNFPQTDCLSYSLDVDIQVDPCANQSSDSFEDNDSCAQAAPLPIGTTPFLTVSKTDSDFYSITVEPGATLDVTAGFLHAVADLDIYLYDPAVSCGDVSNYLTRGFSADDDETISWTNSSIVPMDYVLEVQVYPTGAGDCNEYVLFVDPGQTTNVGVPYCNAVPNSTGFTGAVFGSGSASISANDLVLTTSRLPVAALGYYICSPVSGFLPTPGGSSGNLCLFPPFGRYVPFAAPVGSDGTASLGIDAVSLPQPNGSVTAVTGETWYFQFWHRDAIQGATTSNFSNGLAVTYTQ